MKVGILTYHFSNNYGAVLQAYALMEQLCLMGHEPMLVDRTPIKTDLLHRLYQIFNSNSSLYWTKFRQFQRDRLKPKTQPFYTDKEVADAIGLYNLDALIVGSDQIWRNTMCGHSYFLNFLSDASPVRRISYAASFGTSTWNTKRQDTELIRNLLHKFDRISVRENSGQKICNDVFDVESELVVDPTMLHEAKFYEDRILNAAPGNPSGRLVSYILGKAALSMVTTANSLAAKYSLEHHELYWLGKDLRGLKLTNILTQRHHITVEEWLSEIRDAEYVVTNSFHCAVFSILFKKKFVVLEYESGGNDRLITLLGELGIENRLCKPNTDLSHIIDAPIDYDSLMKKLVQLRNTSLDFLNNSLSELL